MIAVAFISRAELERRLAPYRCRCVAQIADSIELWETGWHYPFTLWNHGGLYEEDQYRRLLANVIATTMPPSWPHNDTPDDR